MTLDCTDIKVLLSGLIDDEVDAETRLRAERHLTECKACREMLNEAEAASDMIARQEVELATLPAGFEDAVLNRTIYGEAYQFAGRRWTSWLGWVAAAACLALSMTIFFIDRQVMPTMRVDNDRTFMQPEPNVYRTNARSSIFDGPVSPEQLTLSAAGTAGELAPHANAPRISRADADTLYAASTLIRMLNEAQPGGFADVERIRQIAEYDQLLDRLAMVRERVGEDESSVVLAAESMLLRIVQGPVDLDDLRIMRERSQRMNLANEVAAISARGLPTASL